jgi:anti-sigma factor RsiW
MRNCIEEGTLQAWFDGELHVDQAANVAAHVNGCSRCAGAARRVEVESLIVFEGLAPEFAVTVPTERLRQRVEKVANAFQPASVPAVRQSPLRRAREFLSLFRPLVYASIAAAILLAAFLGFVYLKKDRIAPVTVQNNSSTHDNPSSVTQTISHGSSALSTPAPSVPRKSEAVRGSKAVNRKRAYEADASSLSWQERQYDYAISKLNEAIKIQPPLRPSLQVEYEYNMAVIDNEIVTSRETARRNPTDVQAAQFMLAAYQSKVDLMNQIANARVPEK